MLNLEELERKIDEALAKETDESLTQWLNEKRAIKLAGIPGEGEIEIIEAKSLIIPSSDNYNIEVNFTGYEESTDYSDYSRAA